MGNGKSATGNSILGRRAFQCHSGSSAVRATCELQQVQMNDGRQLNVIDTPGLFDPTVDPDFLGKEIARCIDLAKDGLHAVLFVLSVRNRYTPEEAAALETLQKFLGEKFLNYMVVIFTGGDELEANEQTLEDYLREIPPALQEILSQCNDRKVLFDNKTRSETVKEKQRSELLKQIDIVIAQNGGHPYSNEMFREAQEWSNRRKEIDSGGCSKKEIQILLENMEKRHAEQLKKTTEMVEEKLRMSTKIIEQQLAAEKSARETKHKKEKPREPCVIIMKEEKPREPSVIIIKEEKPQESGGCVIM
jgi:hypothetical protein